MDASIILEAGTPDEIHEMETAMRVGEALNKTYPNHPWIVSWQGGGIVVRHLLIANAVWHEIGREGFSALLPKDKLGTHAQLTKSAQEFGGQLLELFGMPRGPWDGEHHPVVPASWRRGKSENWS